MRKYVSCRFNTPDPNKTIHQALVMTALPFPLSISAVVVGIGFTDLKQKSTFNGYVHSCGRSATYTSDVVGKLKAGLIYDMDTGINFLSTSDISNENVGWENSIIGELSSRLTVRPCLQAGVWAKASSFANAHAYGEICAGVFAETTLKHDSRGYETPLGPESNMSALVKLNEVFPSTQVMRCVQTRHLPLVQVGVSNVIGRISMQSLISFSFIERAGKQRAPENFMDLG